MDSERPKPFTIPMASKASSQPDSYVLGRDFKSALRLNHQHYLWYNTLHFNLHPTIASNLPSPTDGIKTATPPKIADVACGSGAWLRDVAEVLSHASFDGFDLSLAQCPPSQWLPSNIELHEWNLFNAPRVDMLACYDVVHTRLIFTVVEKEDPRPIIRNLLRMLKPGGYLQWDELDVEHSFLLRADAGAEAPAMDQMLSILTQRGKWVSRLPQSLEDCGFEDARLWNFEERESLAKAFFDNNLAKDEEMAENALKGTEEGERLLHMVTGMYKESMGGVVICTPKVVCTARKAADEGAKETAAVT